MRTIARGDDVGRMYANFPLLYSAAQSITQDYSSSSAHHVMESMRGAMAKVGLFIYLLEKEVAIFQRQCFLIELQLVRLCGSCVAQDALHNYHTY